MSKNAFKDLEKIYPKIVGLMPDEFDSHDFFLTLAQQNQQLYVELLSGYRDKKQPFRSVHKEIAKRLKKRDDLVVHIGDHSSKNIFGLENDVAVWRKVK